MKTRGYYTVEASLILPFTTLIIFVMTYMSFYAYDRCVIKECVNQATIIASSNMIHSNETARKKAKEELEKLIDGRLIAVSDINYDTRVNVGKVIVNYECKVDMPFSSLVATLFGNRELKINVEEEALINRQVTVVRVKNYILKE